MRMQGLVDRHVSGRVFVTGLVVLTLVGLALRLWGIELRSISHPEVYVPGIPLAPGISTPPPRHDWPFTFLWHFHYEPHPLGWYMAMFAWTEVFGTSHLALRLPAALFGAAAIPALGLLGRYVWGPMVGLTAAAILTFHGFHIFWSQNARMYTPGMFLAVVSVLLLLKLTERRDRSPGLEFAYVLTCFLGIQTVELFWPILLLQVLWLGLVTDGARFDGIGAMLRRPWSGGSRVQQLQAVALMLSVPSLSHSASLARTGAGEDPSGIFLLDFAAFGFLFTPDSWPVVPLQIPVVATVVLAVVAAAFAMIGWGVPSKPSVRAAGGEGSLPVWLMLGVLALSVAVMLTIGAVAQRRNGILTGMTVLSFAAFALPAISGAVRAAVGWAFPRYENWRKRVPHAPLLFAIMSIIAPVVLFSVSYIISVLAERAWMVFVPFYLLLVSAGLLAVLPRLGRVAPFAAALVAAVVVASVPYSWKRPGTPQDYQGIAQAMAPEMRPDDLIMIVRNSWIDTPLMYYLGSDARYMVNPWQENLTRLGEGRVWRIWFPGGAQPFDWEETFPDSKDYEKVMELRRLNIAADLYVPKAAER